MSTMGDIPKKTGLRASRNCSQTREWVETRLLAGLLNLLPAAPDRISGQGKGVLGSREQAIAT